jgi:hypothetical protein
VARAKAKGSAKKAQVRKRESAFRLLGEGAAEIDLGNLSRTHQDLPDRFAGFFLFGESLLDIVLGHQAHLLEDLSEWLSVQFLSPVISLKPGPCRAGI